jgi:hypothetical protein
MSIGRGWIPQSAIDAARLADPAEFLEAAGFTVERRGLELAARSQGKLALRLSFKREGRKWLFLDVRRRRGGDNIDLVRMLVPGTGFRDAVSKISHGLLPDGSEIPGPPVGPWRRYALPRIRPGLAVPPRECLEEGIGYLVAKRGISRGTCEEAARQGFLSAVRGGILFLGYDGGGVPRCASWRSVLRDGDGSKRDLAGSSKRFPPVLEGSPGETWIAEGGVNALALRDLAALQGREAPTVVVSGGSRVCSFLRPDLMPPSVVMAFAAAREVRLAGRTPGGSSSAGLERQAALIARSVRPGCPVSLWKPPAGDCRDAADYLLKLRGEPDSISGDREAALQELSMSRPCRRGAATPSDEDARRAGSPPS